MRSYIRPKLTLLLMVWVVLIAAAMPLVISPVHSRPTHAATPTPVTIPSMKLPWVKSLTAIAFTGGPDGNYPDKTCALENKSIMSGVDFGLPLNTDVLAVAAGWVIYAGYSDSQVRNEVTTPYGYKPRASGMTPVCRPTPIVRFMPMSEQSSKQLMHCMARLFIR